MCVSSCLLSPKTHTAACQWRQTGGGRMTVGHGGGQQNWRWAKEEQEEVNRRSNRGGSLLPHWRCLFFPIAETKTGLNLQLNPWPAFDRVSGTGGEGQRAGRRGEAAGVKWGACCCFEVPPRIWKRPIKQDYKSGTAFLFKLSIHTVTPPPPPLFGIFHH